MIDALSESYYPISPYTYVANNPIAFIDPDGNYIFGIIGSTREQRQAARQFASESGGDVKNIHRRNVSVDYSYGGAGADGIFTLVGSSQSFNRDGSKQYSSGTISEYKPNTFGQVKELVNNFPDLGMADVAAGKFIVNVALNIINDATALATGLVNGPEHASNAEGHGLNRAEFTEAGMNTIINLAPTPDKLMKIPGVRMNAAKFSELHKHTKVLSMPKKEVGTIIRQTNNATIEASKALRQSSQAVSAVSAGGNVKQEIDRNN